MSADLALLRQIAKAAAERCAGPWYWAGHKICSGPCGGSTGIVHYTKTDTGEDIDLWLCRSCEVWIRSLDKEATWMDLRSTLLQPIPCGGCGAKTNDARCIGCMHDFGTRDSQWVHKYGPEMELPNCWDDENGDYLWIVGHVSDAVARRCYFKWIDDCGLEDEGYDIQAVKQTWYKARPDDDEAMDECAEDVKGAEPFTRIELTW